MRLLILGQALRVAGGASVGKNLIAALARVGARHEYFLVMPGGAGYEDLTLPPNSRARFVRQGALGWRRLSFDALEIRTLLRRFRPDVVCGLCNRGLVKPGCAQAVLVQDAHFVYDWREQPRVVWRDTLGSRFRRWLLRRSLRSTGLVFCQTQTMCERFRRAYAFQGRIRLMPNHVSRWLGKASESAVNTQLAGKFVYLCIGRWYAHKNFEAVVDAVEVGGSGFEGCVVVFTVDESTPGARRFQRRLLRSRSRERFVNVGHVEQQGLGTYLERADVVVVPSVLETQSATFLEAMHYGRPIIASDLDFAWETCGRGALFVDTWDPSKLCQAMLQVRQNAQLRDDLQTRAREQAAATSNSWDDIAASVLQEIEALHHERVTATGPH